MLQIWYFYIVYNSFSFIALLYFSFLQGDKQTFKH